MTDPDYEPSADMIRQTVLDTIAQHAAIGSRTYNVDAELANAIASAVLTRLASLEGRKGHAQKFDIWAVLLEEFIKIFNDQAVTNETLRNFILATLRQHQDTISDSVMNVINKRKGVAA